MRFRLDSESGVPYYQQVVQQFTRLIASGAFAPGDRLPTVRELAVELALNPNTVARAYQDLERDGAVETRRGQGTFALAPRVRLTQAERRQQVSDRLDGVLLDAQHLGLSPEEVLVLLQERIEENHESTVAA